MNGTYSRRKQLRFETLEPKTLLAADLHALVVGGDLIVVGSKGDDILVIEGSSESEGTWTITPTDNDSINGNEPGESVTLSGVVGDVRVSLRKGNDRLTIKGPQVGYVRGSLSIRGSSGTNEIHVSDLCVGEDLSIRTRGAADAISVRASEVRDNLVIRSAAGADSVECVGVTVGASLDADIGGGWYNDEISIVDSVVGNDLYCRSSRGDNEFIVGQTVVGNRTRVRLGNGADHVQIGYVSPADTIAGPYLSGMDPETSVRTRQLQIHTGGGEDDVDLSHAVVVRHLRAFLGDDADQMTIMDSTIGGNSIVNGDTGDDLFEAGTSYGSELYSAGHHDGTVYFTSPRPFAGETFFDGGEGEDTLRYERDGEVEQDDRQWKSFEQIVDRHANLVSLPTAEGTADTPADAVNAFAADLYHELAGSEENLVFSPLSISAALAMVYAGAEEETAAQMAKVLHFPESSPEFHAEYGELLGSLREADGLEGLDLNVANSLWRQFDFPFSQEYLDLVQQNYAAGQNDVDFLHETEAARLTINQWIEEQTKGKIRELIGKEDLTEETVLVLANAIYFDAKWAHQLTPDATQPADFDVSSDERIRVNMMHDTACCRYMERDGVQYLELPYADERFSMVLALPASVTPISQVDVTAITADLDEFLSGLEWQRVAVSLPKFEITSKPNAKQALIDLGVEDLFEREVSDLDGMKDPDAHLTENLWVQNVSHKAFIELDEAGTTAAAATAVSVGYVTSIAPSRPVCFQADHPFQYFVCDTQTNTILFMGHVSRPTTAG